MKLASLINGNFEQGEKGWRLNQYGAGFPTIVHGNGYPEGGSALQIVASGNANPKYPNETPVAQNIEVTNITSIAASAKVKSDSNFSASPNGQALIRIVFFNKKDGKWKRISSVKSNIFHGGETYTPIHVERTPIPNNATHARIKLVVRKADGTVWFDNIEIDTE